MPDQMADGLAVAGFAWLLALRCGLLETLALAAHAGAALDLV